MYVSTRFTWIHQKSRKQNELIQKGITLYLYDARLLTSVVSNSLIPRFVICGDHLRRLTGFHGAKLGYRWSVIGHNTRSQDFHPFFAALRNAISHPLLLHPFDRAITVIRPSWAYHPLAVEGLHLGGVLSSRLWPRGGSWGMQWGGAITCCEVGSIMRQAVATLLLGSSFRKGMETRLQHCGILTQTMNTCAWCCPYTFFFKPSYWGWTLPW